MINTEPELEPREIVNDIINLIKKYADGKKIKKT